MKQKVTSLTCKLALCLVIFAELAQTALAQTKPPAVQAQPPPPPPPAAVQVSWLFDNRLKVQVEVPNRAHENQRDSARAAGKMRSSSYPYGEFFGHRIGDIIPIRVRIWLVLKPAGGARRVQVDFAALRSGRLTLNADEDPDWVLADASALTSGDKPLAIYESADTIEDANGNEVDTELFDCWLFVQTKRQPMPTNFWFEFSAAASLTPNGKPDWEKAATPDFYLTMSRTSDKSNKDMSTGNTVLIDQSPPVVLGTMLMAVGGILILLPLTVWGIRLVRSRCLRLESLRAEERFWRLHSAILKRTRVADGYALSKRDVHELVAALKAVFGISTLTHAELKERQATLSRGAELCAVLEPLENGVLECDRELTPGRYREIAVAIEKLVPRP